MNFVCVLRCSYKFHLYHAAFSLQCFFSCFYGSTFLFQKRIVSFEHYNSVCFFSTTSIQHIGQNVAASVFSSLSIIYFVLQFLFFAIARFLFFLMYRGTMYVELWINKIGNARIEIVQCRNKTKCWSTKKSRNIELLIDLNQRKTKINWIEKSF